MSRTSTPYRHLMPASLPRVGPAAAGPAAFLAAGAALAAAGATMRAASEVAIHRNAAAIVRAVSRALDPLRAEIEEMRREAARASAARVAYLAGEEAADGRKRRAGAP